VTVTTASRHRDRAVFVNTEQRVVEPCILFRCQGSVVSNSACDQRQEMIGEVSR